MTTDTGHGFGKPLDKTLIDVGNQITEVVFGNDNALCLVLLDPGFFHPRWHDIRRQGAEVGGPDPPGCQLGTQGSKYIPPMKCRAGMRQRQFPEHVCFQPVNGNVLGLLDEGC